MSDATGHLAVTLVRVYTHDRRGEKDPITRERALRDSLLLQERLQTSLNLRAYTLCAFAADIQALEDDSINLNYV